MNIDQNLKKPSLSEDLTVVFLRGNGSPRTFRVPVNTVQRSLTAFAFAFCFALLAALFFFGLNILRPSAEYAPLNPAPVAVTPVPAAEPEASKGGLWQKIAGDSSSPGSGADDSELKKEVDGLRADISRLSAQIDSRKELPAATNSAQVLQLFGPRSVVMSDTETSIRVRNAKITQAPGGKETVLTFELHNTDPGQKQERGYIVALAKTNDLLLVYPPVAFSPSQNIVLDFTKGETFGISRFRAATATFNSAPLAGKHPRFQIVLFSTDGRIIANQHVEEKQ